MTMTQSDEIDDAVKVVYLEQPEGAMSLPPSTDVLSQAFLERIPLDTAGLDAQLLGQFGFDQAHPGIGLAWVRDSAATGVLGAPGELTVATTEHLYFERVAPAVEIVAFVYRVPGISRAEFHRRYTSLGERLRDWGGPAERMCRYAQNHALGDGDGPDAVGELGFATAEDLTKMLSTSWLFDELLPYEAEFVDHSRSIQMVARRR
jgi:hypothetical protein